MLPTAPEPEPRLCGADDALKSVDLNKFRFGSYCLWRRTRHSIPPSRLRTAHRTLDSSEREEMEQMPRFSLTDTGSACRLGIVVPCYNEEEALPETARRLTALLDHLVADKRITPSSRVFFVDDGSSDHTWALIEQL